MPEKTTTEEPQETGYAVYDNTLLKFTGGVHAKKADAEADKKNGPKSHDLEVRKV